MSRSSDYDELPGHRTVDPVWLDRIVLIQRELSNLRDTQLALIVELLRSFRAERDTQ